MAVVEVNVVVEVGELVEVVVSFCPLAPLRNNMRAIRLLDQAMVREQNKVVQSYESIEDKLFTAINFMSLLIFTLVPDTEVRVFMTTFNVYSIDVAGFYYYNHPSIHHYLRYYTTESSICCIYINIDACILHIHKF